MDGPGGGLHRHAGPQGPVRPSGNRRTAVRRRTYPSARCWRAAPEASPCSRRCRTSCRTGWRRAPTICPASQGCWQGSGSCGSWGRRPSAAEERRLALLAAEGLRRAPGTAGLCRCRTCAAQAGVLSIVPERTWTQRHWAAALAERGIAVRAGLHCAPLAHRTAGTLDTGTVRLSFSALRTPREEVYRFPGGYGGRFLPADLSEQTVNFSPVYLAIYRQILYNLEYSWPERDDDVQWNLHLCMDLPGIIGRYLLMLRVTDYPGYRDHGVCVLQAADAGAEHPGRQPAQGTCWCSWRRWCCPTLLQLQRHQLYHEPAW